MGKERVGVNYGNCGGIDLVVRRGNFVNWMDGLWGGSVRGGVDVREVSESLVVAYW